jgi:hypothetical protein
MVAENKTVSGINRAFALTTDQSCLNRWLTEVQWDVQALNDKRLAWLQQAPQTRYSSRGVIAIDNIRLTAISRARRSSTTVTARSGRTWGT